MIAYNSQIVIRLCSEPLTGPGALLLLLLYTNPTMYYTNRKSDSHIKYPTMYCTNH